VQGKAGATCNHRIEGCDQVAQEGEGGRQKVLSIILVLDCDKSKRPLECRGLFKYNF
jgi:hypothetical protein